MGANSPEVGERVMFFTSDGPVFAEVIRVEFWDLVDLRLECGATVSSVRRILAMNIGEDDVGKFERLVPRKR